MMMSSLALPRSSHLVGTVVPYILVFEEESYTTELVFDPTEPTMDEDRFKKAILEQSILSTTILLMIRVRRKQCLENA